MFSWSNKENINTLWLEKVSYLAEWLGVIQSTLVISNNRLSRSEKSGPCYNTEVSQHATKYCGKEEKLLLRSNFSSFPQYFQYISNLGVKLHIHSIKGGCSINCFPQVLQI